MSNDKLPKKKDLNPKVKDNFGIAYNATFNAGNVAYKQKESFYKNNRDGGKSVAGNVARTDEVIIASFLGNQSVDDIKKDTNVYYSHMELGGKNEQSVMIHGGFKEDYESSRDSYSDALNKVSKGHENLPIIFAGHSAGGAVAQLAAADYAAGGEAQRDRIQSVNTFGSPRVFASGRSAAVADNLLERKVCHMVTAGDIVPNLPPASLGFQRIGFVAEIPSNSLHETNRSIINAHGDGAYENGVVAMADNQPLQIREAKKNSMSTWADRRLDSKTKKSSPTMSAPIPKKDPISPSPLHTISGSPSMSSMTGTHVAPIQVMQEAKIGEVDFKAKGEEKERSESVNTDPVISQKNN